MLSSRRSICWWGHSRFRGRTLATAPAPAHKKIPVDSTRSDASDAKIINILTPSLLPTYYFQKSKTIILMQVKALLNKSYFSSGLPRLPIPKLELTCQRYLEALTPLLTQEQLGKTKKIVANFQDGIGTSEYLDFVHN